MSLIKRYKANTPALAELISDSLLIISQSITGYALYDNNPILGMISLVTGVVAKLIVRFIKASESYVEISQNTNTRNTSYISPDCTCGYISEEGICVCKKGYTGNSRSTGSTDSNITITSKE